MQVVRFEIEVGRPGDARTARPEAETRETLQASRDADEDGQRREEAALEEPGYGHGV